MNRFSLIIRVQTSIGCFVARKLVEPILGGKANEATLCEPCALHQNGSWLSVCIAKVIGIFNRRVTSMPRLAFEGLEPCDGKLSCPVPRGLGAGNSPRLPGLFMISDGNLHFSVFEGSGKLS